MPESQEHKSWIVEASRESFDDQVFERSREVPVVVDFWAPWCAPCRTLGPILQELARENAGRFVLVKADTDQLPEAAMSFRVQSIPAVFGVVDGEIVDFFAGALPEPQIRSWLDRLLLGAVVAEASRLEGSDVAKAEAKYREVISQSPNDATASIGLARVLLRQDRADESRAVVESLEGRGFLEPEAEKVKAALELRDKRGIDVEERRKAADANPDDLQLKLKLGEALAGDCQYEAALEICLALVERDRYGVGESARKLMLDVFRVLPDDSELVNQYRRKLSTVLY